jgi:glycosyltransferase involved in cell wall biosynthesis
MADVTATPPNNHDPRPSPKVSVLMATYNGAGFIRASVNSLLAQTFRDFELIIVDDCSTDSTPDILRSFDDPRIRIFHNETNLGVVLSRNRCLTHATGEYIAMQDHDDLSRPTRLAKQAAFLDANPGVVLLGTAAHTLEDGRIYPPKRPATSSPALLAWLLLVANPLICSSIMFRAAAARQLEEFMRPGYTYADDFDLYHRIQRIGAIARLDKPLTVYRLHQTNASRTHEDLMTDNAVRVLTPAYTAWFGNEAAEAAALVQRHIAALRPVPDRATLKRLHVVLRHLTESFLAHGVSTADRELILDHAEELWRRCIRGARRQGITGIGVDERVLFSPYRRSAADAAADAIDRLPFQYAARRLTRDLMALPHRRPRKPPVRTLDGVSFNPIEPDPAQPPTLYVVVDTEAEFDWSRPLERALTNVGAIDDVERGQAVFDRHGLRPVYVVDYPIASNPGSVMQLKAILDRGGCEIGAHLHPWTTPPYDESMSERNSYPGNLPPALELAKLRNLVELIRTSFGISPLFYKAGRYGFGPGTARALSECGIKVDFSILPGADLRWKDGPDFSLLESVPYWVGDHDVLTAPMTRSTIGLLPSLGPWIDRAARRAGLRALPLRPLLARTRIADTITLTPEGVTTEEQIRLINTLLARGTKQFVLHFHSPSLQAGNTSYTPDEGAVARFVASLDDVCRYFFDEIGGQPGYPRDLLPNSI